MSTTDRQKDMHFYDVKNNIHKHIYLLAWKQFQTTFHIRNPEIQNAENCLPFISWCLHVISDCPKFKAVIDLIAISQEIYFLQHLLNDLHLTQITHSGTSHIPFDDFFIYFN